MPRTGRPVDPRTAVLALKAERHQAKVLGDLPEPPSEEELNLWRFTRPPHFKSFVNNGGTLRIEDLDRFQYFEVSSVDVIELIDVKNERLIGGFEVIAKIKAPDNVKLLIVGGIAEIKILNLNEFFKLLRPTLYKLREKVKKPFTRNTKEEIRFYEQVLLEHQVLESIYRTFKSEWDLAPEIKLNAPVSLQDKRLQRIRKAEIRARHRENYLRRKEADFQRMLSKQRERRERGNKL